MMYSLSQQCDSGLVHESVALALNYPGSFSNVNIFLPSLAKLREKQCIEKNIAIISTKQKRTNEMQIHLSRGLHI